MVDSQNSVLLIFSKWYLSLFGSWRSVTDFSGNYSLVNKALQIDELPQCDKRDQS